MINTPVMCYMWLWLWLELELILTLLITMIIQHYRCIMMHYKSVLNALKMDALGKVLPFIYFFNLTFIIPGESH